MERKKVKNKFWKKIRRYLPFIILFGIVLLGAIFRLYRIRDYLTFLGDEGRDVLVVKRIIVDHKFTLLGPITSVGSMYMGPIFYYFMAPFLWLFQFDPVGPAIMVALFSVSTIVLVYLLGREFFHQTVGLVSAFLYAISPLSIIYGRSSWNPNVVPFFSLLTIYSLLKVVVKKSYRWLIVAGFSLGILFQLHYVTFMFVFIVFASLLLIRFKLPIKYYFAALLAFIFSYSPFLLFELRHQFVNTQSVWRFIWQQKQENFNFLSRAWFIVNDVIVRLFWRLVVIESAELTKIFIIGLAITLFLYYFKKKREKAEKESIKVILLWTFIGIFSYALYGGIIYDYYFGSIWIAPFILTGLFFYVLSKHGKFGKFFAVLLIMLLAYFNLNHSPLKISPSSLLNNTQKIARFVYEKTEGKRYNFALIAGKNSDHAYRYFLELWGNPPVVIENPAVDPDRKTVTEDLLIVCEEKECKPLGHPLWEIAGFGQAEIVSQWDVVTAKVMHLKHLAQQSNN